MKKYLTVFKIIWQEAFQYRANTLMFLISVLLPLLALVYFWLTVYGEGNQIGNYSLVGMLSYFVMGRLLELLERSTLSWEMAEEIRLGNLSNYLLKPISYFKYWLFSHLATKTFEAIFIVPIILILLFSFRKYLYLPQNNFTLIIFVFSIIGAIILSFLIFYLLGLFALWTKEVGGFLFVTHLITGFLSGRFLPLDLFPFWFNQVTRFLPFPYFLFFPISIYLEKLKTFELAVGFISQTVWILIFYLIIKWAWFKGIKHYEAVGS